MVNPTPLGLFLVAILARFPQRAFSWCKENKKNRHLQIFTTNKHDLFQMLKCNVRVDGRDMGEMKGEMKNAKALYIKVF